MSEKTVEHTPDNTDKVEKRRASKRAYMQKQRATKAYRERERRSKHNAKNLLCECVEKTNGSISNRHGETLPEANNDASSHTCMRCKKDLFAMIRQLGNPTWFCSFSAAERR